jgi:hypothetical protein
MDNLNRTFLNKNNKKNFLLLLAAILFFSISLNSINCFERERETEEKNNKEILNKTLNLPELYFKSQFEELISFTKKFYHKKFTSKK